MSARSRNASPPIRGVLPLFSFALMAALSLAKVTSVLAAEPRTGAYLESAAVATIAGDAWIQNFAGVIAADDEIEWVINVPESYAGDNPAGVVVYISPTNSGEMPRRWQAEMNERNLIWIAANQSGNRIDPRLRVAYSLLAPSFIDKRYNIDLERIYIAGLSGGGRVASIVAPEYSALFRGAIYICGVNRPSRDLFEKMTTGGAQRFVFLTGENDFNRKETKNVYSAYRRAGIDDSYYLEIREMGHENPNARGLARALAFLDGE